MKRTEYTVSSSGFGRRLTFALISDLHGQDPRPVLDALRQDRPDYILMPGDIFEFMDGSRVNCEENGFALLRGAAAIAPTFFSLGNHENGGTGSWKPGWKRKTGCVRGISEQNRRLLDESGVFFLDNEFLLQDGIAFGGLTSGLSADTHTPNVAWLSDFCKLDAPKVLLCHHPEYYKTYLKPLPLDLIVSGHAHGGQWRIFGRGLFAPGQGIFPKYTAGVHDRRLVISTGLKKSSKIPRIFNEPEYVIIRMT